jgi:hypothetical protein
MKRVCSLQIQTRMNTDVHRDMQVSIGLKNQIIFR